MPNFNFLCIRLISIRESDCKSILQCVLCVQKAYSIILLLVVFSVHEGGPLAVSQMHPVPLKIKNGLFTQQLISQSEADV